MRRVRWRGRNLFDPRYTFSRGSRPGSSAGQRSRQDQTSRWHVPPNPGTARLVRYPVCLPRQSHSWPLQGARPGCCLRLSRRGPSNHLSADGRQSRTRKVRGATMKDSYDFSKGRRGRVVAEPPLESGKVRITIRLDEDLVDYFGTIADRSSGKVGYQTLINAALREYVEGKTLKWEEALRRIIREEMARNSTA